MSIDFRFRIHLPRVTQEQIVVELVLRSSSWEVNIEMNAEQVLVARSFP